MPPNYESFTQRTRRSIVKKGTSHSYDDVEEPRKEQGAVENAGELAFIVHGSLGGSTVKRDSEAQTADTKHLGKLCDVLWPEEFGFEVQLEV
jgi:hypothetical protein